MQQFMGELDAKTWLNIAMNVHKFWNWISTIELWILPFTPEINTGLIRTPFSKEFSIFVSPEMNTGLLLHTVNPPFSPPPPTAHYPAFISGEKKESESWTFALLQNRNSGGSAVMRRRNGVSNAQ